MAFFSLAIYLFKSNKKCLIWPERFSFCLRVHNIFQINLSLSIMKSRPQEEYFIKILGSVKKIFSKHYFLLSIIL